MRKLLCTTYSELETIDCVRGHINILLRLQEPFLATVKRGKLAWFGHVTRHDSLSKTILQVKAPWRLGDAVVGRGNAGWTTTKGLEEDLC